MSLFQKNHLGQLDVAKCAKSLKSQGVISKDTVLIFREIYLQKREEYSGGEITDVNENNELYNGLLLFMIVLLFYYRFQSDPLEKRFGQYKKIESLLKEDIDIDGKLRSVVPEKWNHETKNRY